MRPMPVTISAGDRFGRLVAVEPSKKYGRPAWVVRCDCGNEKIMQRSMLYARRSSCGCIKAEKARARLSTHGETGSPEHVSWASMISRCHGSLADKNAAGYRDRGISVCQEWRASFAAFLEHMGRRPSLKHTLDRINNDRGYEPGNCRWATKTEQARNRRSSHVLVVGDVGRTIAEWAEVSGLSQNIIERRVNLLGWDHRRAVSEPRHPTRPRRTA